MILGKEPRSTNGSRFHLAPNGPAGMLGRMRKVMLLMGLMMAVGCRSTPPPASPPSPPPPRWDVAEPATRKVELPTPPTANSVSIVAPDLVTPGRDIVVQIPWRADQPATVMQPVPDGVQLLRTDPPARLVGRDLVWNVTPGTGTVTAEYRPARLGAVPLTATIGDSAPTHKTVQVGIVRLDLRVMGPLSAVVGSTATFEARVSNTGQLPASQVLLHAEFDPGLDHPSAGRSVDLPLGQLAPGEVRTMTVTVGVRSPGRLRSLARLSAANAEGLSQEVVLDALAAKLDIALKGPDRLLIGETGTWTIQVRNSGNTPDSGLMVRLPLPRGLRAEPLLDGGQVIGGVANWPALTLAPGETRTFTVTAKATEAIPRTTLVAAVTRDRASESRADLPFEAVGVPRLKLVATATESSVDVGKHVTYTATITNAGTSPLDHVELLLDFNSALRPLHASGPTLGRVDSQQVRFVRLPRLDPAQTVEYRVEAEGVAPGDGRVKLTARTDSMPEPIRQDEATRVNGPASNQ